MAKAEKAKAKRKPKPKFTDKEQSERFIGAARKLCVETVDEKFDEAVKNVHKHRATN